MRNDESACVAEWQAIRSLDLSLRSRTRSRLCSCRAVGTVECDLAPKWAVAIGVMIDSKESQGTSVEVDMEGGGWDRASSISLINGKRVESQRAQLCS